MVWWDLGAALNVACSLESGGCDPYGITEYEGHFKFYLFNICYQELFGFEIYFISLCT